MTKYVTAGVSRNVKGTWKVRNSTLSVEDSIARQTRAGDTNIKYVKLPQALDREDLAKYLATLPEFMDVPEYRSVIEATIAKRMPKAAKASKAQKVAKAVVGAAVNTAKAKKALAA
jgi:hypothetical protein